MVKGLAPLERRLSPPECMGRSGRGLITLENNISLILIEYEFLYSNLLLRTFSKKKIGFLIEITFVMKKIELDGDWRSIVD